MLLNLEALIAVLNPHVTSVSDGGGMIGVARRSMIEVVRFLLGSLRTWQPQVGIEASTVNGLPGLTAVHRAAPGQVQVVAVAALDTSLGSISSIWITMNPDKLRPWNPPIGVGRARIATCSEGRVAHAGQRRTEDH